MGGVRARQWPLRASASTCSAGIPRGGVDASRLPGCECDRQQAASPSPAAGSCMCPRPSWACPHNAPPSLRRCIRGVLSHHSRSPCWLRRAPTAMSVGAGMHQPSCRISWPPQLKKQSRCTCIRRHGAQTTSAPWACRGWRSCSSSPPQPSTPCDDWIVWELYGNSVGLQAHCCCCCMAALGRFAADVTAASAAGSGRQRYPPGSNPEAGPQSLAAHTCAQAAKLGGPVKGRRGSCGRAAGDLCAQQCANERARRNSAGEMQGCWLRARSAAWTPTCPRPAPPRRRTFLPAGRRPLNGTADAQRGAKRCRRASARRQCCGAAAADGAGAKNACGGQWGSRGSWSYARRPYTCGQPGCAAPRAAPA